MDLVKKPDIMQRRALELRREGKRIGFVPTMGFLHEGHLSLMRLAREHCDVLVVSIFVNPTQFGPNEDLAAYPRDFERDKALCLAEGVDILFHPDPAEMYKAGSSIWVDEVVLSNGLCGRSRPGHFRGVCTVVAKLFNLVQPDVAVFGEKDAQQLRIIERMVRDLDFPIKIVRGPIVREPDGLAMSSRNKYLSPEERVQALCLKRSLDLAEESVARGERDVAVIQRRMEELIGRVGRAVIDYIEFVEDATLQPVNRISGFVLVAIAVKIGSTRLIDNRVVEA